MQTQAVGLGLAGDQGQEVLLYPGAVARPIRRADGLVAMGEDGGVADPEVVTQRFALLGIKGGHLAAEMVGGEPPGIEQARLVLAVAGGTQVGVWWQVGGVQGRGIDTATGQQPLGGAFRQAVKASDGVVIAGLGTLALGIEPEVPEARRALAGVPGQEAFEKNVEGAGVAADAGAITFQDGQGGGMVEVVPGVKGAAEVAGDL